MKRKAKIKIAEGILFGILLIFILLWLQGRITGGRIEPGRVEGIEVKGKEIKIERKRVRDFEEVVGNVVPEFRVDISSRIMERIIDVKVKEGDRVKKGDVLILLDDRDIRSKIEQAKASLQAAKSSREKAEVNYNRYMRLFEQDAVTKHDLEVMETNYRVSLAEEKRMEEVVRETESLIDHLVIRSPIDGYVVSKYVDPGDICVPGKPLLTVEGGDHFKFLVTVREGLAGSIRKGQRVRVYIDAVKKEVEGDIKEIVYSMDPASRDFTVKIQLPRIKGMLSGMYGRAYIPIGWREAILIPQKALQRVGQVDFVYCKENGRTVIRHVKVGKQFGEEVEIISGINETDTLIIKE
ncbi:MAG: sporulation protein YqfD [Candidatus Aenigmatarchaeota archaeon]